jgi:hypothetical protein
MKGSFEPQKAQGRMTPRIIKEASETITMPPDNILNQS